MTRSPVSIHATGLLSIYSEIAKSYLEKHHRLFSVFGGVMALVIAAIYLKVIPEEASIVGGLQ